MTAIRMMKATKSTAPKDAATIITEGEAVDFAVEGVETVDEDPRFNALIIDIKP